ncbi:hypothetical protein [Merismopedia glauca]|uniref:hypothetical protein n=1 Tax=Merismopedia glauca TaxID=292586 RepID=UPI0030D71BB2
MTTPNQKLILHFRLPNLDGHSTVFQVLELINFIKQVFCLPDWGLGIELRS